MKKIVCFSLALLALLGCLTSCNFTQNITGGLAEETEAAEKVEEMMNALTEGSVADAEALMHPDVAENVDSAISRMIDYLAGREANTMEVKGVNINTSTGTAGKVRQEQLTYRVALSDGEVIYLSVTHISNNAGSGFISFQLVLGVI